MHMLNPQSPIPLYHQLSDIILAKIRSGEYPPDSRIPSENDLAAKYGIGRPTARQATDLLVRKRILVRKRGSGTYVRSETEEIDLFSLSGTISSFQKKGITVTTQILQKAAIKTIANDPENPFANDNAYFLSRISYVKKTPVLIENFYLHPAIFKGIDLFDMSEQSLSRIVDENYYMQPTGGKQNFRIGYLAGQKAKDLDVTSDMPILIVKRYIHFPQTESAIFSELFCRSDRFIYSQTIGEIADG